MLVDEASLARSGRTCPAPLPMHAIFAERDSGKMDSSASLLIPFILISASKTDVVLLADPGTR